MQVPATRVVASVLTRMPFTLRVPSEVTWMQCFSGLSSIPNVSGSQAPPCVDTSGLGGFSGTWVSPPALSYYRAPHGGWATQSLSSQDPP